MTNTCTPTPDGTNNGPGSSVRDKDTKTLKEGALVRAWRLAAAALRLSYTVSEGGVEALLNLASNLVELLPAAVLQQRKEPYPQDLTGKVAIVTGGNAGIGFATAKQLARRGAHVVIACRDSARAEAAVQAIRQATPLPGCCGTLSPSAPPAAPPPPLRVESMPLDLGRLSSVVRFAETWAARGLPLHLLVCNAGVMAPLARTVTEDGLEVQFQVNFLSHWLLTHLLLERERSRRRRAAAAAPGPVARPAGSQPAAASGTAPEESAAEPCAGGGAASRAREPGLSPAHPDPAPVSAATRVVVVSSVVHRVGPLQWGDLLSERSYEPYVTYGLSKLATVIFAKELQRRMDRHPEYGEHDTAVSIHPGIVATHLANNFFRSYGLGWAAGTPLEPLRCLWCRFIDTAGQALLASPEVAASRMLHACLGPREQLAGRYLALGRVYRADKASDDPSHAAQLWETATRLTDHTPHPSLA